MLSFAVLFACAALASAQFQCGPDDGFFRDPVQCDKYYDCYRGEQTEKLCPDGLVFDSSVGPRVEQCNYPFIVSCPEGATLQPPQPSGIECPRLNGYFEHEDAANCDQYYECTNGLAVLRTCATGLVFDEFTGTCQWEHTGIRTGCGVRVEVLEDGFSCPNSTQVHTNGHILDHARYIKPDDCRSFYICMEGKYPSVSGCPEGTVFNDLTLNCDDPANVPGCENYYAELGGGPAA
ncbi:protein obstructor-E [Hyalella azteca]|uniref:Protein obstructor-E n=1 Tax=Hyalella azteca TaxID=294128 RepID=A0A8B7P7C8_HYAAZ|nr:protein obstructor-E [Hyalella azteca]